MGYIYFLLCLISSFLTNVASLEKYIYKVKFIEVPLDHFSYLNNKTFQLKYLVNDTYVDGPNSPVFFYTGNEGDIEHFAQNTGFIWDNAPDLGALIIFAEHRYYGQSLPFGNKSYDPPNLGYLTAEQALADYAELLYQLTGNNNNRPIIAIGGSYGGMLAAWFRMKYPHIISGALAASAPVLQFEDITPCDVFSRILSSVFSVANTDICKINIKKSWSVFQNYSSTDAGRNVLNAKFNFCVNMTKPDDMKEFFDYLEDVYANLAMANYPYENDFLAPLPAYPVRVFCGQLAKDYNGQDLIEAMQKAINIYANYTGKESCLNYKSAFTPSLGTRGWDFQSCTEMVMPMCSGSQDDMFPTKSWDINKYSDDCFKKYNVRPREHEIVVRFGGRNINSASNIIFSNGLLDPWSGGGVLRSPNNLIDIIIIPEGAHHIDLRAANPRDPSSVRQARLLEIDIIKNWIADHYTRI